MIVFHHVSKQYPGSGREWALQDVHFQIPAGETVCFLGHSGAGKSTILRLLTMEERPSEGWVSVGEVSSATVKPQEIPFLRRRMGVVYQDFRLLPDKTIWENSAYALRMTGCLSGKESDPERAVFSELFSHSAIWKDMGPSGGPARMLRKGDWKCVYCHKEEPELYNLREDPQEMANRAEDPALKSLLDSMLSEILSGWDPEEHQSNLDQEIQNRAFIGAAPADRSMLEGEYWQGPKDYGYVDPP